MTTGVEKKATRRRGAAVAALVGLALLPKCVVCVAAYVAVLAGVGAEWCGDGAPGGVGAVLASDAWLATWLGLAAATVWVWRRRSG